MLQVSSRACYDPFDDPPRGIIHNKHCIEPHCRFHLFTFTFSPSPCHIYLFVPFHLHLFTLTKLQVNSRVCSRACYDPFSDTPRELTHSKCCIGSHCRFHLSPAPFHLHPVTGELACVCVDAMTLLAIPPEEYS